jgi:hypothetical protein
MSAHTDTIPGVGLKPRSVAFEGAKSVQASDRAATVISMDIMYLSVCLSVHLSISVYLYVLSISIYLSYLCQQTHKALNLLDAESAAERSSTRSHAIC